MPPRLLSLRPRLGDSTGCTALRVALAPTESASVRFPGLSAAAREELLRTPTGSACPRGQHACASAPPWGGFAARPQASAYPRLPPGVIRQSRPPRLGIVGRRVTAFWDRGLGSVGLGTGRIRPDLRRPSQAGPWRALGLLDPEFPAAPSRSTRRPGVAASSLRSPHDGARRPAPRRPARGRHARPAAAARRRRAARAGLCPAVRPMLYMVASLKLPNVETLIFLVPASNHFMF